MTSQDKRVCPACNTPKSLLEFPTRGKGVLQRRKLCTVCYSERRKLSYRKHDKKRNAERRERWRTDPEYRARNKIACLKSRQSHREIICKRTKEHHRKKRECVIRRYGGKCQCCGEVHIEFLVIDHVHGGGTQEREELGPKGVLEKLAIMHLTTPHPTLRLLRQNAWLFRQLAALRGRLGLAWQRRRCGRAAQRLTHDLVEFCGVHPQIGRLLSCFLGLHISKSTSGTKPLQASRNSRLPSERYDV